MDFDYKKHSLEHLEEWLHDALDCEDVTPQEIYDTIVNVVDENIEYHKSYLTKNIEVLSLLKGNRPVDFDDCMPEWGHSDMEALKYTEEELDAMCDAAAKQEEKDKCREYNLREAEYYNKRAQLDAEYDKVVKWRLPVEVDGLTGDCYVEFPEDLLAAANLKEGDQVEWVDKGDGSYLLRKV